MSLRPPRIDEARDAAERLRDTIIDTPLVPLHRHDDRREIWLKPEIHQAVTSFKLRGVFNAVASMSAEERARGLSTVSAGNTAQALAWCGRHFDVSARSLMPDSAPVTKIDAVRAYGGEPVLVPVSEVFRFLREESWLEQPYAFVHPWIDRRVMVGHATMALEITRDLESLDAVYIPVGGGGLIGGLAPVFKQIDPDIEIIAVEPRGCPSLHDSRAAGHAVSVDCDTICDGVAVPYMTDVMFELLADVVDDVQLVDDDDVIAMIRRLALGNRIIAEGSGALAVAAAVADTARAGARKVCIVTGGSLDSNKLIRYLTEDDVVPPS